MLRTVVGDVHRKRDTVVLRLDAAATEVLSIRFRTFLYVVIHAFLYVSTCKVSSAAASAAAGSCPAHLAG